MKITIWTTKRKCDVVKVKLHIFKYVQHSQQHRIGLVKLGATIYRQYLLNNDYILNNK